MRLLKLIRKYGFENLVLKLINKYHSDGRNDYFSSYRPLLLYEIFEMVREVGEDSEEYLDEFTKNFPSSIVLYGGFYFVITFGQGAVLAIYNNDKENLVCL